MNTKLVLMAATVAMSAALATAASANAPLLYDNFNSDTQALNWAGDSVFNSPVSPLTYDPTNHETVPVPDADGAVASTDLIGAGGPYNFYPGNGNYVDLDGSTGYGNEPVAGQLSSIKWFGPDHYALSFDLGGNARGAADQTTVITLGDFSTSITLASNAPLQLYTYYFTTNYAGPLSFTEEGPSDQQGNILDNVTLSVPCPEPATWAMMLVGFGGIGAALRSSRRKTAVAATA